MTNVPSGSRPASRYVQSPCIRICQLDDRQICTGCLRSAAEIQRWPNADQDERRRILKQIELRAGNRQS